MAPTVKISHAALSSLYSTVRAFAANAIAWLTAQAHHFGDILKWFGHLPWNAVAWILYASTEILHWLGAALITVAKFLIVLLGSLVLTLLAIVILAAIYNTANRVWSCKRQILYRTRFPPVLSTSIHEPRRTFKPVLWPRYGTMESTSPLPGGTFSRVVVEESRGPGWRHTICQSVTQSVDDRTETWVKEVSRAMGGDVK